MKFCYRSWVISQLSICCGFGTHIDDLLVQQNIFLICKTLKVVVGITKILRRTSFHTICLVKCCTYNVINIMNIFFLQSFQFCLKSWSSNYLILKCLILYYAMIMLLIIYFLGCKLFFHWRCTWVKCFINHSTKVKWSFKKIKWIFFSNKGFFLTL